MTPEVRSQAIRRVKILAGQLNALEKQIENDVLQPEWMSRHGVRPGSRGV